MLDEETILKLLSILHAAPGDPPQWCEFLKRLCAICDVNKAALIAHDLSRNDHRIFARLGSEIEAAGHLYEKHYWQFDQWSTAFCRTAPSNRVIVGEEIWPENELRKSAYYNEFLAEVDIVQLVGIPFGRGQTAFDSISLYRGLREDRFGAEQISVLKTVAPHLKVALETRQRLLSLENRVSDLETALDALGCALLLVDCNGIICYLNQMARSILAGSAELFIHKGSLTARSAGDTAKIRASMAKAIAAAKGTLKIEYNVLPIQRAGKRPLHVFVAPISSRQNTFCGKASAVVFIDDPDLQPVIPAETLRVLFGLTPAEVRLALSILDGHSLSEAAELARISRETAKSQMSAVLTKTGTKRQGELIRLLSRLQPHAAE